MRRGTRDKECRYLGWSWRPPRPPVQPPWIGLRAHHDLAPLWTLRSATWYVTCYTLWLGLLRVVAAEDLGEKRHVPRRLRRSTACGSWRKDAGSAGAGSRARSECARPAPARAPMRATRGPRQSSRAARDARARRGMRRGPRGGGRCISRRTYPYCPISPLVHQ